MNYDDSNKPEKMFWGMTENSYVTLMHVAQFGGYILPFLGFILPIVMWMTNKEQSAAIDRTGKDIVNFMISWLLYAVVGGILVIVGIGLVILGVLAVAQVVLVIIAAIKTANKESWKYPLTIEFIK